MPGSGSQEPQTLEPNYAELTDHMPSSAKLKKSTTSLKALFADDPNRGQKMSIEAGDILLDFSKNHLTETTLRTFEQLTQECKLKEAIDHLQRGDRVNTTEDRPAWHTALRSSTHCEFVPSHIKSKIKDAHEKMQRFVDKVHSGEWVGYTGKKITDVVNIGIGGSDLGPRMVCKALNDYHLPDFKAHFIANIDGAEVFRILKALNPETTLFLVASKSFTTLETLSNATTAKQWITQGGCPTDQLAKHFVAISTNHKAATEFGIESDNIFPLWDWVGGRYSLWSTIGLPIALAIGWSGFLDLLKGAETMDQHFSEAEPLQNMPIMLALITFFYSQIYNAESQAILPYSHQLRLLPNFLQQLDMESLGKSIDLDGNPIRYPTGIALWGTEESNGQHSYHQLFHQGTPLIPVDFIAVLEPNHPHMEQHRDLLACCLSQSQALLQGKTLQQAAQELLDCGASSEEVETLARHKVIPGNRPSNTILLNKLTPTSLGSLIALYEHKVYAQSVLLNINAFDQWGVELGKQLAKQISTAIRDEKINGDWDSSTAELAKRIIGN